MYSLQGLLTDVDTEVDLDLEEGVVDEHVMRVMGWCYLFVQDVSQMGGKLLHDYQVVFYQQIYGVVVVLYLVLSVLYSPGT